MLCTCNNSYALGVPPPFILPGRSQANMHDYIYLHLCVMSSALAMRHHYLWDPFGVTAIIMIVRSNPISPRRVHYSEKQRASQFVS